MVEKVTYLTTTYVGTKFKQGSEFKTGIDALIAPANLPVNTDAIMTQIWEKQIDV